MPCVRLALASTLMVAVGASAATPAGAAVTRTALATGVEVSDSGVTGNGIDLDTAPDGSAVAAWLQRPGGVEHVYAARYVGGVWQPAVRVDTGLATPSGPPQVAVGNGGEVTIAFPNGATAGAARLYAVTAPTSAAPLSAPALVQSDPAGWARVDLDVAANGDGYLIAHETKHLWAYRLVDGAFTAVGAGFPTPGGILNANPNDEAGPDGQRAGHVSVDPTGATAIVAWSEVAGTNYTVYARKLSGTAPGAIGSAIAATVPTIDGRPVATSGHDEISLATGGGKTWVAFRANYTYPNGGGTTDRARLLARTFDGTTFGPAQILDSVPSDLTKVTQGEEFPQIAVDDNGNGLSVSHTQNDDVGVLSRMTGGGWKPGVQQPGTHDAGAVITSAGVGAGLFTSATRTSLFARVVGGSIDGTDVQLNVPSNGKVVVGGAARVADGALVAWREGDATAAQIVVGRVDLPPVPAPTPVPTPSTPGGGQTPQIVPALSLLLPKRPIKRQSLPTAIEPGAKASERLTITLNRAARVTLTADRKRAGRRTGGRCAPDTAKTRARKPCVRWVPTAAVPVVLDLPAGTSVLRFTGRLGGSRPLARGAYRLSAVARDAATGGVSSPVRAPFALR